MNPVKALIHRLGQQYIRRICHSEFERQSFTAHNERSIEYRFALAALAADRPESILDVGTGTTAWPHLLNNCGYVVTAIDNVRDYWTDGMVNRHWTVLDVDILQPADRLTEPFDAITCISVLEHIPDHLLAVRNMARSLAPDGLLIITTPFAHALPYANVYEHPDALYGQGLPYICRSSSARELELWQSVGLRLETRELWRLFTGPVWATGSRCAWQRVESELEPHQLGCFAFRKHVGDG